MAQNGITRRTTFGSIAAGLISLPVERSGKGDGRSVRTLDQLTVTDTANGTAICDGSLFIWSSGDFTGKADGKNIIKSLSVDLRTGAWMRQDDTGISHRQSPSAMITSVHGKLRHLVMASEDYGFRPDASERSNSIALQEAVNQSQIVQLPDNIDSIAFDATITIPPNTRILGRGGATRLLATAATAFICEAPDGSGGNTPAPWLEDFDLFCAGNGIRYNRPNGGFSDIDGQQALMRPRIDRVRVRRLEKGNRNSTGVEFNKCFDGLILQSEIEGFDKGYVGRGSDLIEIGGRTRIWKCNTLVELLRVMNPPYRYGSGTRIIGCDLLAARECYLRSNDMDATIADNYFEHSIENAPLTGWAFELGVHDRARFVGNRMQLQATNFSDPPAPLVPKFLKVTSDPGNLFVWEDNGNDGLAFGTVEWNGGGGQKYWINAAQRSRIIQRGTSGIAPLPLPFNSTDVPQELPWRFSPSLPGLRNESYGGSVLCADNAFVIPYAADERHISFTPIDTSITGSVDVWIKAKATSAGRKISIYNTKNGTYVSSYEQPLTTVWSWYKVFSEISVVDLCVFVLNKDAGRKGDVHLGEIVIS